MKTNLGHSRDMPKESLRIWKLTNPSILLKLPLLLRAACADVARTAKAEARNAARAEARASAEARAERAFCVVCATSHLNIITVDI